jgi:leader peptidase (prepilin peptidase)/N-methyltransferase
MEAYFMIPIIAVLVFIFGLILGSFLDVCIYRMPREESIITPRSHCVKCNKIIPWYDNIPLVSILILKRKCRFCSAPISLRHFLVEFLTGAIFLFLFLKYGRDLENIHNIYKMMELLLISAALIVITFIDFEHYIIPHSITVPGIILGLIIAGIYPPLIGEKTVYYSLLNALLGIVIAGGILYLLNIFSILVFKKEGMGGGDVMLMGMLGAFLGWRLALLTIVLASFVGAIVGVILIISGRKDRKSYIPFGPYLALGGFVAAIWGNALIDWYLSLGRVGQIAIEQSVSF